MGKVVDKVKKYAPAALLGGSMGVSAQVAAESGLFKGKPAGAIPTNPFEIDTGLMSGGYDPTTGQITSELSPELQAIQAQQLGTAGDYFGKMGEAGQQGQQMATGAFGLGNEFMGQVQGAGEQANQFGQGMMTQAQDVFGGVRDAGAQATGMGQQMLSQAGSFDPFQAAEDQFSRLDAILEPGRQRARSGQNANQLMSGRLGSTAGSRSSAELEGEIERQRQGLLSEQFASAQNVQDQMVNRGATLSNLGMGQQNQQADLGGALFGAGTQAQTLGMQQQAQTADLSGLFSQLGMAGEQHGLGQQIGTQGIGTQGMQNALGIDSQTQAMLQTGRNVSAPAGVSQAEKSTFENLASGFLGGGGGGGIMKLLGA